MVDRPVRSYSVVVVERRSPVELVVHRFVGNLEYRLEHIECCFHMKIGRMVDKQTDKWSESGCIVVCRMVGRQMGMMVERLGQLRLVVVVGHMKIRSLEDKLEHIGHLNCMRIGRTVGRQQHRWFAVEHIEEYIVAYMKKHKCLRMKLTVERPQSELVVARRMRKSTLVDKLVRRPVEHSLVGKQAYMKRCIAAVVAERQRFEPVAARHTTKNTSADKLGHKPLGRKMVDKMAYMMEHIDFVGFVGQRPLVVDCCYSCFQNIHWCKMVGKLAYRMEHTVVVVAERR